MLHWHSYSSGGKLVRIEPQGTLVRLRHCYLSLQVNDINFENMSNDDAVRVLREIVHKPGLVVLPPSSLFLLPVSHRVFLITSQTTLPLVQTWHLLMQASTWLGGCIPQWPVSTSTLICTEEPLFSIITHRQYVSKKHVNRRKQEHSQQVHKVILKTIKRIGSIGAWSSTLICRIRNMGLENS